MEKTKEQNHSSLDEDANKPTNKDNKFSSPNKIVQKQTVCEPIQLNGNKNNLEIHDNKITVESKALENLGNQPNEVQQFRRQTRASFCAQVVIDNKTVQQTKKKVRRPSNQFSADKRNSFLQSSVAISESNRSVVINIQEPLFNHLSKSNSLEREKDLTQINIGLGLSTSPQLVNTPQKKVLNSRRQSTEAKHSQIASESFEKTKKQDQLSKQSKSLGLENRSDFVSQHKIETDTQFFRAENYLNGNPEVDDIKIFQDFNQVEQKQTNLENDQLNQEKPNRQLIFNKVESHKSENISERHHQVNQEVKSSQGYSKNKRQDKQISKGFSAQTSSQILKEQSQEDLEQDLKNQIENQIIKQSQQNDLEEKKPIEVNQNCIKQIQKQRDLREQETKQIIQKALPKLLPRIRREFDKIEGACDYFEELERENLELVQQIKTLEEEQRQKKLQLEESQNCRRSTTLKAEQDLQEKKEKLQKQMNILPKGYPQKYMYKFPKLDAIGCQAGITPFHSQIPSQKRQKRSLSNNVKTNKFASIPNCSTETKDLFTFESNQKSNHFDFLPNSPKLLFLADTNKYKEEELDQYLQFCNSFMKETPVQGGYAGIWLRGSTQFETNAFNLLNIYNYNFDLAKFHILYPLVMNNPEQRAQVIEIAKNNPKEVANLVQNSVIDLQGCKREEVEVILSNFRKALVDRVNDEQLAHHLMILQKIKISPPADIQDKIQESLQFSKEIKRRCNVQASGFTKNSSNIPSEKKLRLSELEKFQEEISKFSYITPEMNSLEQLLQKARQWVLKVQEIQAQEIVQLKTIQQIHADGKIIPVNFEDLMSELTCWKSQAEELNRKVGDILVMKKTRNRINLPEKKSGKRATKEASQSGDELEDEKNNGNLFIEFANFQSESSADKDNFFKELLKEANSLKLTSENILKLQTKCTEIDKWKSEVIQVFQNYKEEENNFKKYRETYKNFLARSQVFDIDLNFINCLRAKYSLIEWREKVEDFVQNKILRSDVISFQDLSAFDQVQSLLKDGVQKNFLAEILLQQGSGGFEINQLALKYFSIIEQQHFAYTGETGGDQMNQDDPDKLDNEKIGILEPLFKNFKSLQILISLQKESFDYNKQLKEALKKIRYVNDLKQVQQEVQVTSSELSEYSSSSSDSTYKKICKVCEKEMTLQEDLISTNDLITLLGRGDELKVCVPLSQKFKTRVKIIQELEQQIQNAYDKCKDNQYDFCIRSLSQFESIVSLVLKFKQLEVDSQILTKILQALQPYRLFITISTRLIRQYCRPIGIKINQLELVQLPDSLFLNEIKIPSSKKQEQCVCKNQEILSDFLLEKENDFLTLKAFVECLYQDTILYNQQTFLFSFFKETSHGNYLKKILERTEEVLSTFEQNKSLKRQPDFDIQQYFKLLDNIQTCGLAFEQSILEEARREQKREKWIRRFHELQAVSMSQLVESQSTVSNHKSEQKLIIQNNSTSNVKIKQLEQLTKEYQTTSYLNTDEYCQQLAQKLISQQQACQGWLDSFNTIFNSNGQFDPPGGLTFVQQLLQEGENLELNLKEWKDLKTHLIEITEWQENICELFQHPPISDETSQLQIKEKCINLEQLEKLIKDTHDLTDNANPPLIELLTSLKNTVTIWKYKAKVIFKIRPIENLQGIIQRSKNFQEWHSHQKEDLFCICQQPENGSLMICCDFCEMWYHHSCIGLSPELKFLDKLEYKCITCAIREGKFTHTVLIPQSNNQLIGQQNILQNHLVASADDLYGPYFDNILYRNNLVKEIDSLKDQISSNIKEAQPLSGSTEQGAVQQIHSSLLEHFSNKQRISEFELIKLYQQGLYALPIQLEELKQLEFYVIRIQQFKQKAQIAIKTSSSQLQLWKCFLTINNPKANQENILNTQEYEFREDWTLINLIAESESLPVLLAESKLIVLELQTRDWFREGFSIVFKCCETQKQNKVKLRRQIKHLLLRAEVLLAMDPRVSKKEFTSNYLKTQTVFGINIVYLSWLLIRVLKGHFLFVESANPSNEQLIENILPLLANETYWIFQEIETVIRKSAESLNWLADLSRGFSSVIQIQFMEQN